MNTARFLRYVWSFYNIMHERVKQWFIAEVLQLKNNSLQKQATPTDGNTTEQLFHQMEKQISFLHDKLKSKNILINLLLVTLIKYKGEKRNIHSNYDVGNIQLEKNITHHLTKVIMLTLEKIIV